MIMRTDKQIQQDIEYLINNDDDMNETLLLRNNVELVVELLFNIRTLLTKKDYEN